MNPSIVLAVVALGYLGALIFIANQVDLDREPARPTVQSSPGFRNQELAIQQRSTLLRWMLYGLVALNLIYALLLLQLGLVSNSPEILDELKQLDVPVPQIDQTAAVVNFVIALILGIAAFRIIASDSARQRLRRLIGERGLYNPDSSVHMVAAVLALMWLLVTFGQLISLGGLSGLAQNVELNGVSVGEELLTAALMIAAAFLGIGLAIRRTWEQALARLSLRLPTRQDVAWGIGTGLTLYGALIVMVLIWSALVPESQIEQQSSAAQQIANAFNTLPLAFILSLAAAVSEEILFRGALQPVFGLISTSLFFALLHIQYTLTPATIIIFVVGLGLGWLRQRQSTSASIIAHFVFNFIQLALAILFAGTFSTSP